MGQQNQKYKTAENKPTEQKTYITTELTMACSYGYEDIAMKLLERIDECDLSYVDSNRNTPLMLAVSKKMENVAMKMLEKIDRCNIGRYNEYGNTALILACIYKMENVAMKLLERIYACNIGKTNYTKSQALTIACDNCMEKVIVKIINHTHNIEDLNRIKDADVRKNIINGYINYQLEIKNKSPIRENLLDDSDKLKQETEILEEKLQKTNCMYCNEITDQNVHIAIVVPT